MLKNIKKIIEFTWYSNIIFVSFYYKKQRCCVKNTLTFLNKKYM